MIGANSSRLRSIEESALLLIDGASRFSEDRAGKSKGCTAQDISRGSDLGTEKEETNECVPGDLEFLYTEPFLPVQQDEQPHPVSSGTLSLAGLLFVRHREQPVGFLMLGVCCGKMYALQRVG